MTPLDFDPDELYGSPRLRDLLLAELVDAPAPMTCNQLAAHVGFTRGPVRDMLAALLKVDRVHSVQTTYPKLWWNKPFSHHPPQRQRVLDYVLAAGAPVTCRDIADATALMPTTVQHSLARLRDIGLIECVNPNRPAQWW